MEYTSLGRSGLQVSRLCLGTMNFGRSTTEKEAFGVMDKALEVGINFFDTANVYGGPDRRGLTEEIIGRWFALGGGRRESVVLATKVYNPMGDKSDGPNDAAGLSAFKIRRSLERSLNRLQTDHIELLQMHHVDRSVTWDELWGAFEPLVAQGVIDYVGSSNFGARHLCYAQQAAAQRHFLGLVSEQHKFSLVCRLPELEVLPAAEDLGLGLLCWSPLGGGILSGRVFNPDWGSRTSDLTQQLSPAVREQCKQYSALCRDLGAGEAAVALAWLLSHNAVTAPIIGPRTDDQVTSAISALDLTLSVDVLTRLDEIFPGPGGEAPEAYAW
ncbi:MAG: aldo/keto reductase [Propionibacteriaceae bacterium]|jgi:aryl-alcohol dehydrogenase-like predicted oxidoreductase|nr:aldo/keto reductase [Propionibacteriaceae bacterium]